MILNKEEREHHLLKSLLTGQKLPSHMLPIYMSSREVLHDFIKCLPQGSPYRPFVTTIFTDESKWYVCLHSNHQVTHSAAKNIILEGSCRVWTHRAPCVSSKSQKSVDYIASWKYYAAATVNMSGYRQPLIVHVSLTAMQGKEPTWDDVVRGLQGGKEQVSKRSSDITGAATY